MPRYINTTGWSFLHPVFSGSSFRSGIRLLRNSCDVLTSTRLIIHGLYSTSILGCALLALPPLHFPHPDQQSTYVLVVPLESLAYAGKTNEGTNEYNYLGEQHDIFRTSPPPTLSLTPFTADYPACNFFRLETTWPHCPMGAGLL